MAPPIINPSLVDLKGMVIKTCPPTEQIWLDFTAAEQERKRRENGSKPKSKSFVSTQARKRQEKYAKDCRELTKRMTSPEGPYPHLSPGFFKSERLSTESTRDGSDIEVVRYTRKADSGPPEVVIVYYHGGGLWIGEADSEELSCLQLLRKNYTIYSVGYRLLPDYSGAICRQDAIDGFNYAVRLEKGYGSRVIIYGSSSGGEMAAFVSQYAVESSLEKSSKVPFHGIMLRCPVTSDIWSGRDYVPEDVRHLHTTAKPEFYSMVSGDMTRKIPRDGLEIMPLEVDRNILKNMPPTWMQLATNDTLYGDGLCYAALLRKEDRTLAIDVVENYPHTFWLLAPDMPRAIEADKAMLEGLDWLLEMIGEDKVTWLVKQKRRLKWHIWKFVPRSCTR